MPSFPVICPLDRVSHRVVYLTVWYLLNLVPLRGGWADWLVARRITCCEGFKMTCWTIPSAARLFEGWEAYGRRELSTQGAEKGNAGAFDICISIWSIVAASTCFLCSTKMSKLI